MSQLTDMTSSCHVVDRRDISWQRLVLNLNNATHALTRRQRGLYLRFLHIQVLPKIWKKSQTALVKMARWLHHQKLFRSGLLWRTAAPKFLVAHTRRIAPLPSHTHARTGDGTPSHSSAVCRHLRNYHTVKSRVHLEFLSASAAVESPTASMARHAFTLTKALSSLEV